MEPFLIWQVRKDLAAMENQDSRPAQSGRVGIRNPIDALRRRGGRESESTPNIDSPRLSGPALEARLSDSRRVHEEASAPLEDLPKEEASPPWRLALLNPFDP